MQLISRQDAETKPAAEDVCPYTGASVNSQVQAATATRLAQLKEPPGNMGAPFFGTMRQFGADPFNFTLNSSRKYGGVWKTRLLGSTVVFFAGARPFSFFMDPKNFTRESGTVKFVQDLLHPNAVPFLDGDIHKRRKRLLLAAFGDAALESYLPNIYAVFNRFAKDWIGQDKAIGRDVRQLVFDLVNVLFAAGNPYKSDLGLADDFMTMVRGTFSMPVNLPGTTFRKALQARDRLRVFLKKQVADNDGAGTALGMLKQAKGPNGERLSAHEIEIELLHFFFAATSALGSALAWSLVVLGQNPELAARLRAEVDQVLGANAEPTFSQVRKLTLATQVAREVVRAYPMTTTTFVGIARRDLEIDGMIIRRGWKGIGLTWATQQDADMYQDPARFDADRLTDETMRSLPDCAYVPMGGGPRDGHRCGGEEFVRIVVPAFIAWFVRNHDWTFPPQDLAPGPGGVGPLPRGGLRMQIQNRALA